MNNYTIEYKYKINFVINNLLLSILKNKKKDGIGRTGTYLHLPLCLDEILQREG